MTSAAITSVFSEAISSAIPESSLSVSEWAATYRYLSAERSARPGRWRNELVPYLVEIMDCVGKPGVREIVLVASAQVGKTEAANNILGFFMHADPSPILYVAETEPKAEAWSKESLAPMIRDTPVLANLVSDARSRDSGNTIGDKSFPGGHLAIGHATSAATLSSRPRRVVILDERDAYKPTSEGDPAKLAEARTKTFDDAIIFKPSTPRNRLEPEAGAAPDAPRYSPIEWEYENSDKRRYFVPCPHCGEFQVLEWKRVTWDSEETALAAYYVCVSGCVIEHEHKTEMLARGEWRAEREFRGRAGFHIWEGYSPFVTWGQMVVNFLEAKKSRETLKVFVNTSLAEGWEDTAEQATVDDLTARRESYELVVPLGVVLITAGVDVQGDRLECEIVGWGADEESWSIDYKVFEGDPAQPSIWLRLSEYLTQEFPCAWGGVMRVAAAAVDTGGHHTNEVYRFCARHRGRRFYAVKGANTPGKPLAPVKPTLQGREQVPLYTVGTEAAKDTLAAHLLAVSPGPGYCHFPTERVDPETGRTYYGDDYFKQLRSERPTLRAGHRVWQKIKQSLRNEALDCRVYAMAAKAILKPNMKALAARVMAAVAAVACSPAATPVEAQAEETTPQPERDNFAQGFCPRRGGGFVNNW